MDIQAVASRPPVSVGRALAGFFLSGFLLAFVGAILPAWGYYRDPPEFVTVGNYFLAVAAAVIGSNWIAIYALPRRGASAVLVTGCGLACAALLYLSAVTPPAPAPWRMAGLALTGAAAGLLNTGLFHALSAAYAGNPGGTVAKGGLLYGVGCLAATAMVAATFYTYTVPSILVLMAAVPGMFAGVYVNSGIAPAAHTGRPSLRDAFRDFRSPGAVVFALLLFFQFGNEWSIAGWLPLFLVRRLGISPRAGLLLASLYWLALLAGRAATVWVIGRVRSGRLVVGSVLAAIFGLALLFLTDNSFGAATGAVFAGAGFAGLYPVLAEMIGRRFPYYHPAFFSGIFSFALIGGMLAPATLGYFAAWAGVGVVMALPLAGMCMVLVLLGLIWLETKVTGR